ncbi:hypothetical protein VPH35_132232 [Triticum aestivum]
MGGHHVLPLLILLLLLLVQGRGGYGAITIATLHMDIDMGVEVAQMGAESAAHGRVVYINYDAPRGDAVLCSRLGVPYYNCRVSTTANPLHPRLQSITRCHDETLTR